MGKKAIFGAFFHWDSFLQIGSHQYAKQFARKGYKVAYISNPISPLHYIFAKDRNLLKERSRVWHRGGKWVEDGRIWTYVPLTLIPVYRRPFLTSRWIVENSNRIIIPSIGHMLERNNFKQVDMLFLDETQTYLLDLGIHKKSVYRIHDDISYLKDFSALFKLQEEVIQRVDLVIICSKLLESTAKELGAKEVLYLPNAVDFEHFHLGSDELPAEYNNIPSPRVIYVGSVKYWFDVDLVVYIAKRLPDVSFILIGKPRIDLSKLASLSNVYILGIRRYEILPKYLKNAEIGIIPWDYNLNRVKASHPNKLYYYMACGLSVVSTKWRELEYIKSPGYLASNKEEFVELIEKALTDTKRDRYIKFAKANSWEKRFEKLMEVLYPDEGD